MNSNSAQILITGSGSLCSAILHSIIHYADQTMRIAVVSRESGRLQWLARSVAANHNTFGLKFQIEPISLDWADQDAICRILQRIRPRVVIHTASLQSPWSLGGNDSWSKLIRMVGYGFTLPLHLLLAQRLARAVAEAAPNAMFLNACYPDAANPVLVAGGLPVLSGLGNVAILATLMGSEVTNLSGRLRMIAHHSHIAASQSGNGSEMTDLKAWHDETLIDNEARTWLKRACLPTDQRLNLVTGAVSARTILSLSGNCPPFATNLPGPLGLPGGYPVYVNSTGLSLDLPGGMTTHEAIAINTDASSRDGVIIQADGRAEYSDLAIEVAREVFPNVSEVTEPFSNDSVESRARLLMDLRRSLTDDPALSAIR